MKKRERRKLERERRRVEESIAREEWDFQFIRLHWGSLAPRREEEASERLCVLRRRLEAVDAALAGKEGAG